MHSSRYGRRGTRQPRDPDDRLAWHRFLHSRSGTNTTSKTLLFFGYTQWSHGRIYYDLCKLLHERGYVADLLDWQASHSPQKISEILSYYRFIVSALDGIAVLVDIYGVPYERIIALSHAEMDLHTLIDQKGVGVFEKFAGYGVVSYPIFTKSTVLGVRRHPSVVPYGLNCSEFHAEIAECLTTVGYASSMSQESIYGVEIKRGELAEEAARKAGLAFKVAGSTANQILFHDMPDFYRTVDAVVMTSVTEGDPLSVREAAAAGRLVIGTPAGQFPHRAYEGAGIIAPIEAEKSPPTHCGTTKTTQSHTLKNVARYRLPRGNLTGNMQSRTGSS